MDLTNINELDPAVIVAVISLIGTIITLTGTIALGFWSYRSEKRKAETSERTATAQASDEIATGSSTMLREYRVERENLRSELKCIRDELNELKLWKMDVIDFLIPFVQGSKANEQELIRNGIEPPYRLPEVPEWLNT